MGWRRARSRTRCARLSAGLGIEVRHPGENFRVNWTGLGAAFGNLELDDDWDAYWGQADFVRAGLIAKLEGNLFNSNGSSVERFKFHAHGDATFIDVQFLLRELKFANSTFGVIDGHGAKARGKVGGNFRWNQKIFRGFVGIDVESGANFEHES